MKRTLDKTWLKVTAFLLFFVFAAFAAAGILGTVYLASNDIYLQGDAASREVLYRSQASRISNEVQSLMTISESTENFIQSVRGRLPAEDGYGMENHQNRMALALSFGTLHPADLENGPGDRSCLFPHPSLRQLLFDAVAAHGTALSCAGAVHHVCCHWVCHPAAGRKGIGRGRLQLPGGYPLPGGGDAPLRR